MQETEKIKKELEEILLKFLGIELNHFYLADNGNGRIILKTSRKYKSKYDVKVHPLQEVGRLIIEHYYRFGKASVYEMLERGEFKKG